VPGSPLTPDPPEQTAALQRARDVLAAARPNDDRPDG
jgi:hypothetical protein